jgi:RNA polymerase sigma-70 factor, ECF subfamily
MPNGSDIHTYSDLRREDKGTFWRLTRLAVYLAEPEISGETIEACRQGDRSAFRCVYEARKDRIYSIALYFFNGDAATASDVTQQVFLKLLTDFQSFRGDSAFSTWLYRLVVNTCVDTARRSKARGVPLESALSTSLAVRGSQEDDVVQKQVVQSIQSALATLPPPFRIAILLRYFDDLSYEEIAKVLNCSIGTVSSRLSRGHRLLAGKLSNLRAWLGTKEC